VECSSDDNIVLENLRGSAIAVIFCEICSPMNWFASVVIVDIFGYTLGLTRMGSSA